jgi:23S rRNA (cytidine1920-2'-O)/16S rRNA (cytidine1409-2'-O)-methyltransferase
LHAYGQFDWSLRNDGRVMLMERTNARHLEALEQAVDFTSVDVSFISLKHIFPAVARISEAHAEVVTLIKPQFEAGKGQVGKKGVVRDPKVHTEVIENVISYAEANGFRLKNLSFSPIKGPSGNIEYLAYFCTSTEADISAVSSGVINDVVENAFVSL